MAIGITFDIPGMTQEQHTWMADRLLPKVKQQAGFIAHMSGPTENGYRITEVWETDEDHDRWVRDHVAPLAQEAGITPPSPEHFTVEHVVTR